MACGVNSFGPEPYRGLVFSKHSSGHFNKSLVLSLDHTILLRCVSSRKFMSNAIFIKKIFDMSILEFNTIITSDMLDCEFILGLRSLCKCLEDLDNFALII